MGVSQPIDISPQAKKTVKELLQRYLPGVTVWAYGSRVKWTARPDSDLDLVVFANKERRRNVADLREAFEESNLPFRVDMFIWNEVPEKFREEIREGHVVVREGDKRPLEIVSEDNITRSPEHWRLVTLGEICKESGGDIQTGPFGSQLHASDYVTYGTPSIMPKNIAVEGIDTTDIARISEEDADRLSKYLVRDGDIIYSRRGDVEKCALVTRDEEGWLCGTGCLRIRLGATALISAEFLHAYLSHSSVREWVIRHAVGATMPNLNTSILAALPVPVPSDTEQDTIGSFWRKTIWKIQLNRRMNQTLEAMAQAIFKSWFVDFDPVKVKQGAKAFGIDSGRAAMAALGGKLSVPKNPADLSVEDLAKADAELEQLGEEERKQLAQTAALFPDGFVGSELGLIPEGWEVRRIEEIAERVAMGPFGSRITRNNFVETGVPVIRGNNLTDGFNEKGFVFLTEEKANELQSANAFPGDIVFTHRGTLGQVGIIPKESQYPRYVVSQSQMLLRVNRHLISPQVMYLFFRSTVGQHALLSNTSQTGVPAISRPTTSLKGIKMVVPPKEIWRIYDEISHPLISRVTDNSREVETLTQIRDTFLPKLLSGELPVSESG